MGISVIDWLKYFSFRMSVQEKMCLLLLLLVVETRTFFQICWFFEVWDLNVLSLPTYERKYESLNFVWLFVWSKRVIEKLNYYLFIINYLEKYTGINNHFLARIQFCWIIRNMMEAWEILVF